MTFSKEVLGTGLSGLIGSRVVELNPQYHFTDLSLDTGFDILKPDTLKEIFNSNPASVVVHLAAFTDTNAAWEQRGDKTGLCYRLNVDGTQNVVELCQRYGKHLVHISTDYVFNGQKMTPYVESDVTNPLDWYAETKLLAEELIPSDDTIIRIASPYRAKFDLKIDLVRKIISKLKNGEICKLFTDQITTPTFIDDIGVGIRKIIDNPKPGIYHCVGSSSQSIFEMGKLIAGTFGFDQNLVQSSSLADYLKTENARPYAPNLALSNQKFVDEFGYVPRTLIQGLEELKKQLSFPL